MLPLLDCSVVSATIIIERLWTLQQKRVLPQNLTSRVWDWVQKNQLNDEHLLTLRRSSPLGEVLAAGLINRDR